MIECLVNGEMLEHIHVADRGLNYGDGLFETLAVIQGRPRWWQDHIDRLAAGCERLGMQVPAQAVLLREVQTVSAGQFRCVVKIILSRGPGSRAYRPAEAAGQTRIVSAHAWPHGLESVAEGGAVARVCDLKLAIQPRLGGMKHLNRLEQVLASMEMAGHEATEGILLDMDGYLISAISANLFLVSGHQLLTPRLDRSGVRGVLRARILKAFKARCEQRRVSHDMLAEANEVFLCSSLRGIIPLRRIGEIHYGIGPVTRELQQWLKELQERK
jgi:4-amino-4-deoxychorismate lyase